MLRGIGNVAHMLPWGGQATAADVAPSAAAPDTPKTQELGNVAPMNAGAVPSVFGLPPILVALLGLVGVLYVIRAVTTKGG